MTISKSLIRTGLLIGGIILLGIVFFIQYIAPATPKNTDPEITGQILVPRSTTNNTGSDYTRFTGQPYTTPTPRSLEKTGATPSTSVVEPVTVPTRTAANPENGQRAELRLYANTSSIYFLGLYSDLRQKNAALATIATGTPNKTGIETAANLYENSIVSLKTVQIPTLFSSQHQKIIAEYQKTASTLRSLASGLTGKDLTNALQAYNASVLTAAEQLVNISTTLKNNDITFSTNENGRFFSDLTP